MATEPFEQQQFETAGVEGVKTAEWGPTYDFLCVSNFILAIVRAVVSDISSSWNDQHAYGRYSVDYARFHACAWSNCVSIFYRSPDSNKSYSHKYCEPKNLPLYIRS